MNQLPLFPEPKPVTLKLSRQQRLVLERLRRGPATSVELNAICFRYGGRIHELRGKGYAIQGEQIRRGLWRYWIP